MVHGIDKPATVSTETVDFLGLLCWVLGPDLVIARFEKELDTIADDKSAMGQQQREEALAQISSDALEIHRSICALIWAAEARGEIIEFPSADVPPEAVIGVRCVQASRSALSGTSLGHAIDIIGDIVGGRR